MKTIKEIGKIMRRAFLRGRFNWLICMIAGGILYAVTKHLYWLLFGIIFGAIFDKDNFLEKGDKNKEIEKE